MAKKQIPRLVGAFTVLPTLELAGDWVRPTPPATALPRWVSRYAAHGPITITFTVYSQSRGFWRTSRKHMARGFRLPTATRNVNEIGSAYRVELPLTPGRPGTLYLLGYAKGGTHDSVTLPGVFRTDFPEVDDYIADITGALSQWGARCFLQLAGATEGLPPSMEDAARRAAKAFGTALYPGASPAPTALLEAVLALPSDAAPRKPRKPAPKDYHAPGTVQLGERTVAPATAYVGVEGIPEGTELTGFTQPFTIW